MANDILVVKVGTSTLLGSHEEPSRTFEYVANSVIDLSSQYRIVLVTSGAIGFGVTQLGLSGRPHEIRKLQALSMIGQVGLLRKWREAFDGVTTGQVLVTRNELRDETTGLAFRESIEQVWEYGAIPIVNENDAVSNEEISFGDNDRLAAEVAISLKAKSLVMLTDQNGIQAGFGTDSQYRLEVVSIDDVSTHILPSKSVMGKGGASSKVIAASLAVNSGIDVFIAHAAERGAVEEALSGKMGTKIVQ